jgi:nucleotide-binding universal stress UspA family protein
VAERVVVVGVDGSTAAALAASVAAREAGLRGARLRVVAAWQAIPPAVETGVFPVFAAPGAEGELAEVAARSLADEVCARLRTEHPGVEVEAVVAAGPPALALLDEAAKAELVVVGTSRHSAAIGVLLGSVARKVAREAEGLVLVVPPGSDAAGSGVVATGIGTHEDIAGHLDVAVEEAQRRQATLRIVHVWWSRDIPDRDELIAHPDEPLAELNREEADALVTAARAAVPPGVPVETREVDERDIGEGVVEASTGADLLVLGNHRHRLVGIFFGIDTAQECLAEAPCPVLLVPHRGADAND